jgi:steroid delta-isomerase-like uncharacterized protein
MLRAVLRQVMASQPIHEKQNKELVQQFFDAYNAHDAERMGQLVSSYTNYLFHIAGMALPMDWNGRKQFVTAAIKAFPDIDHHILDIVAEGNKVAVRFNITGTHKGEFQGIRPTGKVISIDGMGFLIIEEGKIVEEWLNSDMMGLMQQIGATPSVPPSSSTPNSVTS